jgi:GT2 family glycosyltransferase
MSPEVAIVILNYNGWQDTIVCLQSLTHIEYSALKVIVVDNSSTDDSVLHLTKWIENNYIVNTSVHFIISQDNKGFSAGNNLGIRYALDFQNPMYFWILNNDTVVRPNALTNLVYSFENLSTQFKLGILGCKILKISDPSYIQCIGGGRYNYLLGIVRQVGEGEKDLGQYDGKDTSIDYVSGASMFLSKEFLLDVGFLSEDYFLYFEEIDLALRGKRKGWCISTCTNTVIFHKEGATINPLSKTNDDKSELSDFNYFRSKLLFTSKNLSWYYYCSVAISSMFSFLKRIFKGKYLRAFSILLLIFNPFLSFNRWIIISKCLRNNQ